MEKFEGFIDFYAAELHEHVAKTTFFFLTFNKAENLKKWGESEIHNQVIGQLKPYMTQDWQVKTYQTI